MKLTRKNESHAFGLRNHDHTVVISVVGESTSYYLYCSHAPVRLYDETIFSSDHTLWHNLKKALGGSQEGYIQMFKDAYKDQYGVDINL